MYIFIIFCHFNLCYSSIIKCFFCASVSFMYIMLLTYILCLSIIWIYHWYYSNDSLMNKISLMDISLVIRNSTSSPSIYNPISRGKIMPMLWLRQTNLCTLLFYVMDGRKRVYIPSSAMFSHLCQMSWDEEKIYLTGFIGYPMRSTAVFLPPLMIYKLSNRWFICLWIVFLFTTLVSGTKQN